MMWRDVFFVWMLHGSTKVVVRAVALLSAKTKWIVANTLERFFHESNKFEKHNETKPPTTLQSSGECRGGWVKPVPRAVRSRASWQRREHACQPSEGQGNACSIGWKMLQILKRIKFWLFATSMLWCDETKKSVPCAHFRPGENSFTTLNVEVALF